MSVINTNTLSLVTQNNLTKSQGALNSAIERLSSGMRINSAKDDAAGQAVANRFTATIRGLTQASRNANDGISMAQTTEGALNEVNNNLQRVRELTVQSSNGSASAADKASIQGEITARLDEINRISAQTDFNGTKVLSTTAKSIDIQVGAKDGETVAINLKEISTQTLGLSTFNVNGPQGTPGAAVAADYQKAYGSTTGVVGDSVTEAGAGGRLAQNLGVAAASVAITATALVDDKGNFFAEIAVTAADATEAQALNNQGFSGFIAGSSQTFYVALDPLAADTSTGLAADWTLDTTKLSVSDLSKGSTPGALTAIDAALKLVDDQRGALGAVQNRFDSVIANLGTTITNLSSSRSRIEDADYATEVSNMTRAQILQQAGTSVLAKANSSTEGVMSLLR